MRYTSRTSSIVACWLGLLAIACGDTMGPSLADPAYLIAALGRLDSVFANPAFESFYWSNNHFKADGFGFAPGAMFPPGVSGTTYVWDTSTVRYAPSTLIGAPPEGVRFVLYTHGLSWGPPILPLEELGFVDLRDQSSGSMPAIQFALSGTHASDARYEVSGTSPATGTTATGVVGGKGDRVAFVGTQTFTKYGPWVWSTDASFELAGHELSAHLVSTSEFDGVRQSFTIDFTVTTGAQVVTLSGSGSFTQNEYGSFGGGTLRVRVNGKDFATAQIDAEGRSNYQGRLSPADREALAAIDRASGQLRYRFGQLLSPATYFLYGPG